MRYDLFSIYHNQKQELQRLKRDYLAGKENQSDPTRPSPPSSLTVATEPPTHTQLPISVLT